MDESLLQQIESIDWECEREDTRYLTHAFHPYSSKYIPQIPRYLVDMLTAKGETVLDPFVGSGTTLVECKLLGRNSIGVDVNPLACLISKVKATSMPAERIDSAAQTLFGRIGDEISIVRGSPRLFCGTERCEDWNAEGGATIPYSHYISSWFQPQVIRELTVIKRHIDDVGDEDVRDFFCVAFSSILRTVSKAANGFGNLMISRKEIEKRLIYEKFKSRVRLMTSRMGEFSRLADGSVGARVVAGDARDLGFLSDDSVDMICSHPPYMASVPYAEYQKLFLWWLGHDPNQLDARLIGGQRSRQDTAQRYMGDMRRSISEMYRVVRGARYCCVVIGNPVYRGRLWPLNEALKEMGTDVGFRLVREVVRGKYKLTMGKMKKEFILIFRK